MFVSTDNYSTIASDVASALEYREARDLTRILDDDEKGPHIVRTLGGNQEVTIINESGLYAAILKSRKPEAKKFKKWVTSEVLPSIRKTGSYNATAINPANLTRMQLIELAMQAEKERLVLEGKVQVLEPKAEAMDRVSASKGSLCITDAAKVLKIPPREMVAKLSWMRWIYRRLSTNHWIGYQDKIQYGYLEHRIVTIPDANDLDRSIEQVMVTSKGLAKLSAVLNQLHMAV